VAAKSIFEAVLQPTLDPSKLIKDVEKLEKDVGFSLGASLKGMGKLETKVRDIFNKGVQAGFSPKNLKGLRSTLVGIQKEIGAQQQRIATLQRQYEVKMLDERSKKIYQAEIGAAKARMALLEKQARKEIKTQEKLWKIREEAEAAAEKDKEGKGYKAAVANAEAFTSTVQRGFANLKSADFGGFSDMIKELGETTREWGIKKQKKAGKEGGASPLGGLAKKLGPVVVGLGALTGILAAVAAGIMGIDMLSTKWTASLADAGVNIASLNIKGQELKGTMDTLRKATTDNFGWMRMWGVTSKDTAEILAGFEKGGKPLSQMFDLTKKNTKAQEQLRSAMEKSLAYAKLFGMGAGEMSEKMGEYMENFGLSLDGVTQQFASLYEAAKVSGFSTKRFVETVLQATSNMSMLNVRFSETAGLLITLGKILGQKMAPEFLNELTEGFSDASITDNLKQGVFVGKKKTSQILKKQATDSADFFLEKMKGAGVAGEQAAKAAGVKVDFSSKGALVKSLSKMSRKEQRTFLAEFRKYSDMAGEGNQGVVTSLNELMEQTRGVGGNAFDQAVAMKHLGPGGSLAMKLEGLNGKFGDLSLADGKTLAAIEKATGRSGKSLTALINLDKGMRGNHGRLLAYQKKVLKEGKQYSEQERIDMVKSFGAYINDEGKMISAKLDEEGNISEEGQKEMGKSFIDYAMSQKAAYEEVSKEEVDKQLEVAQEVAQNTTDMNKILEMGVEKLLEGIYGVVQKIFGWMSGTTAEEKEARSKAVEHFDKEAKKSRELERAQRKKMSEIEKALRKPKLSDEEKQKLNEQKEIVERQMKMLGGRSEAMQEIAAMTSTKEGAGLAEAYVDATIGGGDMHGKSEFMGMAMGQFAASGRGRELAEKYMGKEKYGEMEDELTFADTDRQRKSLYERKKRGRMKLFMGRGMTREQAKARVARDDDTIKYEMHRDVSYKQARKKAKMEVGKRALTDIGVGWEYKKRQVELRDMEGKRTGRYHTVRERGGLTSADKAMGKIEEEISTRRQKENDASAKKRQDDYKNWAKGELAESIGEETADEMEKRREKAHAKYVAAKAGLRGTSSFDKAVKSIMSAAQGRSRIPQWLEDKLAGKKGSIGRNLTGESSVKNLFATSEGVEVMPGQQDFLMRLGGRGEVKSVLPHNANDALTVVGAKPGGPLDKASGGGRGGGAVVVNNEFHLYGTPQENYKQIKQALSTAFGRDYFVGMNS
jgi:hypothetical protein